MRCSSRSASCSSAPVEYQPTTSNLGKTFLSVPRDKAHHWRQRKPRSHAAVARRRTLLLLFGQEGAVDLRHVVAVHAVVLDLERVGDVHRACAVRAKQAAKHSRRLAQRLLRLKPARQDSLAPPPWRAGSAAPGAPAHGRTHRV